MWQGPVWAQPAQTRYAQVYAKYLYAWALSKYRSSLDCRQKNQTLARHLGHEFSNTASKLLTTSSELWPILILIWWLVAWEINSPLSAQQWAISGTRICVKIYFCHVKDDHRYSNLQTSLPFCSVQTQLSYYASIYNTVESNQPPRYLLISSMWHLV